MNARSQPKFLPLIAQRISADVIAPGRSPHRGAFAFAGIFPSAPGGGEGRVRWGIPEVQEFSELSLATFWPRHPPHPPVAPQRVPPSRPASAGGEGFLVRSAASAMGRPSVLSRI